MIRQVRVYRIVAEMVLGVNADTEREALDRARKLSTGRPASDWKPTTVSTVALIYVVGDNEGPVRVG